MKRRAALLALIIGLITIAGILLLLNKGRQPLDLTSALAAEIAIEPTESDSAGVDTTSNFLVKTSTYIDPKIVAKNISVEPEINFTVEEQKNTSKILLIPDKPLQAEELYRFTLNLPGSHPLKWAFQTKGEFKINGSLPRDKSTGVPTNTGIEISFSHLNFENPEKYFEIVPKVKGRFERHKKTAVFVPEALDPGTVYTVTVKKGLKLSDSEMSLSQDYVFQFETQDPEQHNQNQAHFEFYNNTMDFATGITPVIPLGYYSSQGEGSPEMKVTVYKYKDAAEYIGKLQEREEIPLWAYSSRSRYLEDTEKHTMVENFTTQLKRYGYETFLQFPKPLPAGYYLGDVSQGSVHRQIWFQVSDLAVYSAVGENETLVWVNSLETGAPAANAQISLFKSGEKKAADQKGLARLTTPDSVDRGLYLMVASEGKEAVVAVLPNRFGPVGTWERNGSQAQQEYWKYLYLDRGLYKPNDVIQFWGLVKPRSFDQEAPKKVTVSLTKWNDWQENVLIDSKEVKVEGTVFSDHYTLPNLVPGYYNLAVKVGDQVIAQQGFDVQTYTKPSYKINVLPDQKAVVAGDTVHFKIETTCFEDTPVPNTSLTYSLDQSGRITTDMKGQADLPYTPQYRSDNYGSVQYRYLYLNAALPESGEISAGTSLIVLNNDINILGSGEIANKTGKINIAVEKLTVDKVNQGEADPWEDKAFFSGSLSRHPVTVTVFRQEWDQIEDGEYYDFINKTVEKRYRYQERKVLVAKSQVTTDRAGKAVFKFPADPKKSYWVELTAKDLRGNWAKTEIYVSGAGYPRDDQYPWYHFDGGNEANNKYGDGEKIVLTVKNHETIVPERLEGFMFYTARQGIMDCQIQDTGTFETVFSEEMIPNFWVRGVYFDGKVYHEVSEYLAAYDEKEKALNISVWTDKKEYRPKDKVNIKIEVKDHKGRPVRARVNLNLVDEALFALSPQQVNLLGSLYGDYLAGGVVMTASTHKDPTNYFGGAEQGGEGGSERKDFKDAAFFQTLTTDWTGKAAVSFSLPDNLTSWRLTYQAVSNSLQAESGTAKINVKLPFFVDLVLNEGYLAGDQPSVFVRAFGSKLEEGTNVNYTIRLAGGEEKFEKSVTAAAFETVSVPLPPLKKGSYQITLTGKSDHGMTDVLTRSFSVADTFMTQQKTDHYLLNEQTKIKGSADAPTTLIFTDYKRSQYLTMLCSLAGVEGSRIEQKIAPHMAEELFHEFFPKVEGFGKVSGDFDPSSYQTPEGGIGLLPYGGPDLEVSAKIAALCEDRFDLMALKSYFYRILNDPKETRERGIIALYGLSSLEEPVLQEIGLAVQEKDLTVKEQLYLILALNELGNEQPARKMLKDLLKKYGEEAGPYTRVNTGSDSDDVGEITALAALAAGRLMFDDAHKLQQYVIENPPKDSLIYLEQIMFLRENLTRLPEEEAAFSFSTGSKPQNVDLAPGDTFSLMLAPEKLESLKFSSIKGSIGVTAVYQGAFTPPETPNLDGVTINRDYQVSGKSTRQFSAGDLVEITISWKFGAKAPEGTYQITDYLPAGLKIVEKPYNWNLVKSNLGWPVEINGQKAVFLVSGKGSLRYYARVINAGKFTAENAVIHHAKNGRVYSMTASDKVEIK